jgi:pimeloyl-ACP methyl ester carboxylesterase
VHRFDVATPWVWGQAFLRDQEEALAGWRAAAAATDPRRAHALIAGMAAFEADAGPALATLRCPVLALHGEDDVMTPPATAARCCATPPTVAWRPCPRRATPPPSSGPPPSRPRCARSGAKCETPVRDPTPAAPAAREETR